MKQCSKCKFSLVFLNFSKNKKTKDGLCQWCKLCSSIYSRGWAAKNKAHLNAYYLEYNRSHVLEKAKYFQDNKKYKLEINKCYRNNNRDKFRIFDASRRAIKLNAKPKWLNKTQLNEIKAIYALAKELQWLSESKLVIDHIIPLQGNNVCGLHVPWNLQILTQEQNLKKFNKVII